MSTMPAIKPVLEFLAPYIVEAYNNSPALPPGTKGRSPSPVLPISAEELMAWAKSSPENTQAYKEFRKAANMWDQHQDALAGLADEGLLESEGIELKRAKAALQEEIDKHVDAELRARVQKLQEELKPLLKDLKDQEKEAYRDAEVNRLNSKVEEMKALNSEATSLAGTCQLANHLVDAFRNKEPKLERGQSWATTYTAYGLIDPTANGAVQDNAVEA